MIYMCELLTIWILLNLKKLSNQNFSHNNNNGVFKLQCCAARDHQMMFVFNVLFLTIDAQKCYILLYQNDHQFLLSSLSFVT